ESMRTIDGMKGARILVATAKDGRTVLPEGLRQLGAHVDVVHMYRSRPIVQGPKVETLCEAIDNGSVHAVTFTSASTVTGFLAQVGRQRAERVKAISIGPVTSDAARSAGLV